MSLSGSESRRDGPAEKGPLTTGPFGGIVLREGIAKLVAPNPSVMTGPGTNSYVLGTTKRAIVDPGPLGDTHLEQLLALGGPELSMAAKACPFSVKRACLI